MTTFMPYRPLGVPRTRRLIVRRLCTAVGLIAAAALPSLTSSHAVHAQTARADHVVLISIDGLRPEFYLDAAAFGAPTIQQMAREGVHALGVRGVFPSVTYPSHTTLITGAMPARHGVYYNLPFEPNGQSGRWYWEADSVRVPTLFEAMRANGRTSGAVMWPVTVGAPVDYLVPEVWSLDRSVDRLAPMRDAATTGLLQEIERDATGRLSATGNFNGDFLTRDDKLGAMAAHILETRRPNLLALHLIGTDHFQHAEGRRGALVSRAVAALDRAVGQVVDAAERAGILHRTAFVITGDHGFVNTQLRVDPNVRLADAGLRDTSANRGEWRAAFHVEGGAAFLHLRDAGDTAAITIARRALAKASDAEQRLYRVVERAELDRIGTDPRVPFALTAANGVRMGGSATGPSVRPSSGGTHGYFPSDFPDILTGFVGWGAGFQSGMVLPSMGLEDVALMVAELLGVPFTAVDGVLHGGALTAPPSAPVAP